MRGAGKQWIGLGSRGWNALLASLAALGLFGIGPASAHELGVARAELRETQPGRYTLTTVAPGVMPDVFGSPRLPERFEFVGPGEGTATSGGVVRFEFSCPEAPLTARDSLVLPWRREGVVLVAVWLDGSTATAFFPKGDDGVEVQCRKLRAGAGSKSEAARDYLVLGIEHILLGIDHLLFVLGLLFIVRDGWALAKTITAFTAAHSITLALAAFGLLDVPSPAVDAVVALSIMFLGVEIIHARQGKIGLTSRFPWLVAFAFGLVHGLGFAGALNALGLPQREIPLALLCFNVGVEIGQLLFVLTFVVWRAALRRLEVRFPGWSQPIPAYGIGVIASYWFIGRLFVLFQGPTV